MLRLCTMSRRRPRDRQRDFRHLRQGGRPWHPCGALTILTSIPQAKGMENRLQKSSSGPRLSQAWRSGSESVRLTEVRLQGQATSMGLRAGHPQQSPGGFLLAGPRGAVRRL